MIRYEDALGKDLASLFPAKTWQTCHVGGAIGAKPEDLHLGFEGWEDPDIILDPRLPLDMTVDRLGLAGKFAEVKSDRYLNMIHGDCSLTHACRGLLGLLAKDGILVVRCLDTIRLAEKALSFANAMSFAKCQLLEKFCFRPALDVDGLLYQQTFLNIKRLIPPFSRAKQTKLTHCPGMEGAPPTPDEMRLDEVTEEGWARTEANARARSNSLDQEWPHCACCERLASRSDENQSRYSRYCKDHYHLARTKCEEAITVAFTFQMEYQGQW